MQEILFRPNTKFTPSGYVDILLPPASLKRLLARSIENNNNSEILPVVSTTQSYSLGHYDKQRVVLIQHKSSSEDKEYWESFFPYVDCSIPVKVSDYHFFRIRRQSEESTWSYCSSSDGNNAWIDNKHIFELMPESARNCMVTVQCADAQGASKSMKHPTTANSNVEVEIAHKKLKTTITEDDWVVVDRALSVVGRIDCQAEATTVFLGQENQLTMELKLQDVLELPEGEALDVVGHKYNIYVAQETIVSTSSISTSLKGYHSSLNEESTKIVCSSDGSLALLHSDREFLNNLRSLHCDETEDLILNSAPLSGLVSGVRLPYYLLQPEHIQINSVNFWYAPTACRTNTHYDSYHNLLLVVSGTKTVELSPPGTVQPSAFFSEHANHPLLLRPRELASCQQSAKERILEQTRLSILSNTMVVSISAGEALYIPPGWWHRVESTSGCIAINVWFDSRWNNPTAVASSILSTVNNQPTTNNDALKVLNAMQKNRKHMLPFLLRELAREYFDEHFTDWARHKIAAEREKIQFRNLPPSCSELLLEKRPLDLFVLCKRLLEAITFHHPHEGIQPILELLHFFLYNVDLENSSHRRCAMKFFSDAFDLKENTEQLVSSLLDLTPMACFIITQIWEKHNASTKVKECGDLSLNGATSNNEAEESFHKFFMDCGAKEESVRAYLAEGVYAFRCEAAKCLLLDDILMGATST